MPNSKPRTKWLSQFSYLFFLLLGIFLLFLAFRKQDFSEIWRTFQEADWVWVAIILSISILNHLSRAMRWQLLIQPLGKTPALGNTFVAMMAGYLTSYAIPRAGEITRVLGLSKVEEFPAKPLFGTVVTERLLDICCLFLVVLLALCVEFDTLSAFYFSEIHSTFAALFSEHSQALILTLSLGAGIFCVLAAWVFWKRSGLLKHRAVRKLHDTCQQLLSGIFAIFRLKRPVAFWLHTAFIWGTYFLMTYLWFFSFEATSQLSWQVGLAMMVIGSFARSLPIQGGGMGAYHYLFQQGMLAYGVAASYGTTLALMIHGLQTVYYLTTGGICVMLLSRKVGKLKKATPAQAGVASR